MLLVENQPEGLLALEAVLSALNQILVRASSGDEALEALNNDGFALVLLATQMPGMDGYETAAHIKRNSRTREIPIIFLSAPDEMAPHGTFRGYAAGAVDQVSRPYDPWVLRAKVAVFIDLHQTNMQLRKQAELLRTGDTTGLLAQLSTLLSDAETEARDLTAQLRAQASSTKARAAAGRLEHAVRDLRQMLEHALELQEESGAPPAPTSLLSPRRRDL
ncbi:response regulator [Streptomyces sp. NPDC002262]|uniref:response regulator n=1 Tax=Streptomyces sp. NPDC002262 TaxID=3154414 RepID=UPI0033304FAA